MPTEGYLGCLETSLVVLTGGGGRYWRGVGRGQGCWSTSYSAQDSTPQQRIIWPQTSVASLSRTSEHRLLKIKIELPLVLTMCQTEDDLRALSH